MCWLVGRSWEVLVEGEVGLRRSVLRWRDEVPRYELFSLPYKDQKTDEFQG